MTTLTAPPPPRRIAPTPPRRVAPAADEVTLADGSVGDPTGVRRFSGLARALRGAVLVLAIALLVRFMATGWPEIRGALALLTSERLPLVGLAVVAETMWVYAMSQVYRSALLAFGGRVSRPRALRISMAAFTLSRILPGGGAAGGAVAARELVGLGNPALRTVMSMLASWWITMAGLALLSSVGIAAAIADGVLSIRYLVVPTVALVAFVVGGVGIALTARNPGTRRRASELVARGAARLGPHVAAAVAEDALDGSPFVRRSGLVALFAWGIAVWITDAAAMWLALAAFGWQVDIGVLLVAYGVANLVSALPELTPGWLGVLEATVAVTLTTFGVPEGIAAVSVLVYRLVSYWLPTAAGIPAAIGVVGRRRERRPQVSAVRHATG